MGECMHCALHCCGQLLRALTFPKVILAFTKSTLTHRFLSPQTLGDRGVTVWSEKSQVDTWGFYHMPSRGTRTHAVMDMLLSKTCMWPSIK